MTSMLYFILTEAFNVSTLWFVNQPWPVWDYHAVELLLTFLSITADSNQIPFVFSPLSVSSALLPHAAAEEKSASRGGHSGEGRLDDAATFTPSIEPAPPPHHPQPPLHFIATSPVAPIGRYILHRTGPEEPRRWRPGKRGVNQYWFWVVFFLSGNIGNMFTVPVSLKLNNVSQHWALLWQTWGLQGNVKWIMGGRL